MIGPPGSGKTMLARRLRASCPADATDEALQIATIASAGGLARAIAAPGTRAPVPRAAPHRSDVALIGGGDPIRPGEVTLAHGGVLFLDELPGVSARRGRGAAADDGVGARRRRACARARLHAGPAADRGRDEPVPVRLRRASAPRLPLHADQIQRYRARVLGPAARSLRHPRRAAAGLGQRRSSAESAGRELSARVRARVRRRAHYRAPAHRGAQASGRGPHALALAAEERRSEPKALSLLHRGMRELELSLRAYTKVLTVARTIADLER